MERLHEFGDGGGEVPPVDVEEIDVVCLEFLQASVQGDAQALGVVAYEVGFDFYGLICARRCEFGREDYLVAVLT